MTSMIQSYVNNIKNNQTTVQNNPSQNYWRTGVKAYKPRGYIVKSSPLDVFQNDINSIKYFCDGIRGRGNDYSIGRINDTAIKLTGLGIAGIIAASNGSPFKKGMEFVGLACWLGAMSLWPKLAVNTPIKLFKGVDLDAEYITSHGHKKRFYNDPQFICWDMLSDEQMNKMGDKLGVPRNIHNRRKAIENKARQVSIQGNTLALLTAGFATPLAASLAADQLGKHVLYPMLTKSKEAKAEKMKPEMLKNQMALVENKSLGTLIEKEVPKDINYQTRQGIYRIFENINDDPALSNGIRKAIDKIIGGKNVSGITISLDENMTKSLTNLFNQYNPLKLDVTKIMEEFSAKYSKTLSQKEANHYVERLIKFMISKKIISREDAEAIKEKGIIRNILQTGETISLNSRGETIQKLKDLSKILHTYKHKVHDLFDKRFYSYVWDGAVSTNADIWEIMPKKMLKALGIENKILKQISNAPSEEIAYQLLSAHIDRIIKDPQKYNSAIDQLGKLAANLYVRNEKQLQFSLDYVDNMQRLLTSYSKNGEFGELTSTLASLFAERRKNILGKFASASNTMFDPIKILSVLKSINDPQEYEIVKKVMFENQTVDSFINRLDHLKDYIKDENTYKRIVNLMFADISPEVKSKLPKGLAEKIDNMSVIMKYLFATQNDGVNTKYTLRDTDIIVAALKKLNLYKYADEFYEISFSLEAKNNIVNKIKETINSNPKKADELLAFLKLSNKDILDIRAGNFSALDANLYGNKTIGPGFLESGRYRIKTLLDFLGINDLSPIAKFNIEKAKSGKASAMQAPTFKSFIKSSAQKIFAYNGWLKKVGFAFVGLCAITAFALSRIGKTNEFNPDIYKERSKK